MPFISYLLLVLSLVLHLLMAACLPARAKDCFVVRAVDSAIVTRTNKAITAERANFGSVAKIVENTKPAPTYTLLYVPPSGGASLGDSVEYAVDGQTITTPFSVRSPSPTLADDKLYVISFKALFALLILAVLVESGLALIFRWRPFLDFFDARTVNSLIAFAFSFALVSAFGLDITTTLINTYSGTSAPAGLTGLVLTALIIAGGSAGVNRVFQSLGFRPVGQQQAAPTPPANEAWISVTLIRDQAIGPVTVEIGPPGAPAVAGTISGTTRGRSWWRYFLRDKGRFPQSGGYALQPGQDYEVRLAGINGAGQALSSATWGPRALAPHALIDLELKI